MQNDLMEQNVPAAGKRLETLNATGTLPPELLHKLDAYWRAANYLSVAQIYLLDNPLLRRPLTLPDIKHMLLGQDMLEIRNWTWNQSSVKANSVASAAEPI